MPKTGSPQTGVTVEPLESRALLAAAAPLLSKLDVSGLLARAASQAESRQAIVVSDRDGAILGIFSVGSGATKLTITKAIARARTAAFFQSRGEAFTTRTARFIIQDHFPHPVPNTPGGPLYGVEFSSLPGSDIFSGPAISGDPGGIPLYKNGEPVGGIGVAGDGHDIAARQDFLSAKDARIDNRKGEFFNGVEESDFDEAVALAGAKGFMAPDIITADKIFLDGLRLPFTQDSSATGNPQQTLDQLVASDAGSIKLAPRASQGSPFRVGSIAGIPGEFKNPNPSAASFGIVSSNDAGSQHLTSKDVTRIISDALRQASITRGGIRQPIGLPAQVHVAVVDRDGDILGVFKNSDATNFSYDVAVQKARTAAFFSDDRHAFSTRGIGFLSQRFFPAGIDGGSIGPYFGLQNQLSTSANMKGPLRDGITIFPGGVPLYKNGVFVGAVGVSGDGVDQDDIIAFTGGKAFQPPRSIRCDELGEPTILDFLRSRLDTLDQTFTLSPAFVTKVRARLSRPSGLDDVQLPYVKFPRNPEL
jgi:uncharacterized protein GlcG (DUF336 family)